MNEVRNIGMAFLKPTIDSCSGNGCRVVDVVDGVDTISNESISKILQEIGDDWVLQDHVPPGTSPFR